MKKLMVFVLVAALALSMTACSSGTDNNSSKPTGELTKENVLEGKKIAFTNPSNSVEFFALMEQGLRELVEEAGGTFIANSYDLDATKGVELLENYITQGVDAIFVMITDPSMEAALQMVLDAGITVVVGGYETSICDACVINNNTTIGNMIATTAIDYINANMNGEAHVLLIMDDNSNLSNHERAVAMESKFKELAGDGIVIVDSVELLSSTSSIDIVENYLLRDPELNVVVSYNDNTAIEAGEALKGAGLSFEEGATFGCDLTTQAIDQLQNGGMLKGSVSLGNVYQEMVDCLKACLLGEIGDGAAWYCQEVGVTSENIKDFTN